MGDADDGAAEMHEVRVEVNDDGELLVPSGAAGGGSARSAQSGRSGGSKKLAGNMKQFDYVFVFDRKGKAVVERDPQEEEPSTCCGFEEGRAAKKRLDRKKIMHRLRKAGLECHMFLTRNEQEILVGIKASTERLMRAAEVEEYEMHLKDEFGGAFAPFEMEKKELYVPQTDEHFFRSATRGFLIMRIVEGKRSVGGANLNVGKLKHSQVIVQAFPTHDPKARRELLSTWAKSWRPQPLDAIRDYFGEQQAMYFAWLGFYTIWLGLASIVGVITTISIVSADDGEFVRPDGTGVILYAFFVAIWCTLMTEMWSRRQASLAHRWGTSEFESLERSRPDYWGKDRWGAYVDGEWVSLEAEHAAGEPVPKSTYYSTIVRRFKMGVALGPLMTMVGLVIAATVGVLITRATLQDQFGTAEGGYMAGAINAVAIQVLNQVYRRVAVGLVSWTNFRTQTQYEDALVGAIFQFQFVNSYISLFYVAFFRDNFEPDKPEQGFGCGKNGCLDELHAQLAAILLTRQFLGQAQEVLLPYAMSRGKVWLDTFKLKRAANANLREEGGQIIDNDAVVKVNKLEREARMTPFGGVIDEYAEMVIQFGYVTLFAPAFPLAPLVALVNNLIEIRTDALKLLTETQRPPFQRAQDIGTWQKSLEFIGVISVITNSLVIAVTSQVLRTDYDLSATDALWAAVAGEHIVFAIKFVIALLIPDVPGSIRKERARQVYYREMAFQSERERELDAIDNAPESDGESDDEFEELEAEGSARL